MAKFTARDFKTAHADVDPFEVELEDDRGAFDVSFSNPNRMKSKDAFELAENGTTPKRSLEILIGDEFPRAWAVLGEWETGHLVKLIQAANDHFRE